MRSEAGSVKKFKFTSEKQLNSPGVTKREAFKDPRMEYFDSPDHNFTDLLPKNKVIRTNTGSLEKILFDRRYAPKKQAPGSG